MTPSSASALMSPRVLDSGDVLDELARRGLPSSKDSLSRLVGALFWPGELAFQPRGGPGQSRRMGNTGNAFSQEQLELVAAATELIRSKFLLNNLKTLRLFARQRGNHEVEVFQSLARLARAQRRPADVEMTLERSA